MLRRPFRVFLLLFVALWFGVIVPGHRRGQILLPGAAKSCCSIAQTHGAAPAHPEREPLPNRAACAVCHFIAMLDLPAAVQLDVPPLGFTRISDPTSPAQIPAIPASLIEQPRAPPIA